MTKNKKPLRGGKLARAVINQIVRHPETWNQEAYHCGTQSCFAGHAEILAGYRRPNMFLTRERAVEVLRIDQDTSTVLFHQLQNLKTLIKFAASHERKTPAKFDKKKGFARL